MKKLIYGVLFFALVGIGVVGCKKESDLNSNREKTLRISQFKSIGIDHNKGLEFTFNYLKQNGVSDKMSINEIKELVKEGALKFLSNKMSNNELILFREFADKSFENSNTKSSSVDLSDLIGEFNVSPELANIFEEFDDICDNNDVSENISLIENLEFKALDILNNDEEVVFFGATSVAKATYDYWKHHQDEWMNLINNLGKASPSSVAKADVGGAVGGAMAYWWLGGPVGWGASILGGALIGSASEVFN
jgi:hypothetical protein